MPSPTVIVIAGPTGSGKTALAVQLARLLDTVIISADARQCFRETSIGVAKPSGTELATIPHYFINSHSIHDSVNAAVFEKLALQWAGDIFSRRQTLVLAGGSGLYINAFCDGLDQMPAPDPELRQEIREQYAARGISWLQEEVRRLDPDFASRGEMQNPHRLQRALEVVQQTGSSILSFHRKTAPDRGFRVLHFALNPSREILLDRINNRVDQMMENGLEEEVRGLYPFRTLPALQTVGYQEFFPVLDGMETREHAIALVKQHTRQYAKRQLTWLRRDGRYEWLDGDALQQIMIRVKGFMPE